MKKKILMRGLFGLPTGIAIGFVITLIISICIGNGSFYPVTPELIDATGNELNAVILQTVLCAIMGAGFAAASIVWELDSWSLAKQSGIYFMIISVIMLPIAYFTNWMKHTALGVLSYVAIFVAIFVVVWLSQYLLWKRKIKQMNTLVNKDHEFISFVTALISTPLLGRPLVSSPPYFWGCGCGVFVCSLLAFSYSHLGSVIRFATTTTLLFLPESSQVDSVSSLSP